MELTKGTKEWADSNVNIAYGCSNNCKYCYARRIASRFHRKTTETWKNMELNWKAINKSYRKRVGRIMFPSSHDIVPEILDKCIIVLEKLLKVGNNILITTKPNFKCVKAICNNFLKYRDQIQFRFTITSYNNKLLRKFEPNAPNFEDRLKSLKYAYQNGFRTSVSIEPFLDYDPIPLIITIKDYITESIWIGPLNYYKFRELERNYTKEHLLQLYRQLKNIEKIRFKDSFLNKIEIKIKKIDQNRKLKSLLEFR